MTNLLSSAPLYYPSAKEWMWDYCIYLGPYTDKAGDNYDLGILIDKYGYMSNATVYGNEPGQYISGTVFPMLDFNDEITQEVIRRAKELKLIP
jgi:hypothetical protein